MGNRKKQSTATAEVVELRPDAATDPAAYEAKVKKQNRDRQNAARARRNKEGHVTPMSLHQALTTAIESAALCGAEGFMVAGNWVLEVGSWEYLVPGAIAGWTYGQYAAGAIIAGELALGHYLVKQWRAHRLDGWTWCLGGILIGAGCLEAVVAVLRETAAIHHEIAQALQAAHGPTLPPDLAGHPQSIEAWTKAQAAATDHQTGQLVAHAKERSAWEIPALVLGALFLSAATAACAAAFTDLVHALLAIPGGIVAWWKGDPAEARRQARQAAKQDPTPAPTVPPRRSRKGKR